VNLHRIILTANGTIFNDVGEESPFIENIPIEVILYKIIVYQTTEDNKHLVTEDDKKLIEE